MASITYYSTIASKIDSIDIKDGNLIFCRDTRTIYLDARGERTPYNTIITLVTEDQRTKIANPLMGYYFVKETKVFWHYEDGWTAITNEPKESIVFYDEEKDLPSIGQDNVLYIVENSLLRWKDNQYIKLGEPVWNDI
jgi:hypothetical protein